MAIDKFRQLQQTELAFIHDEHMEKQKKIKRSGRAAAIEKTLSLLENSESSRRIALGTFALFDRHYAQKDLPVCSTEDAYLTAFTSLIMVKANAGEYTIEETARMRESME